MVDTRVMLRKVALLLLVWSPFVAAAEQPVETANCVELPVDPRPDCIEAVVLARFLDYRPGPLGPLDEDEIVLSWTWDVDIRVRKVYFGDIDTGRLTIGATLHTRFNDQLKQPLLFLTRKFDTWYLAYIEFAARDASGNMVLPIFETPDESYELSPKGWMPHDYAKWLKPVNYRGSDVAAFGDFYEGEPTAENGWVHAMNGRKVARRGFRAEDIPAMLAERRAIECAREKPDERARL